MRERRGWSRPTGLIFDRRGNQGRRWWMVGLPMAALIVGGCAMGPPASRLEYRRKYPVHTVKTNETVYSIARRYKVDVRELIDLNELTEPDRIFVGQDLLVPTGFDKASAAAPPPPAPPPAPLPTRSAPAGPSKRSTCKNAESAPLTGSSGGLLWPIKARSRVLPSADGDRSISEIDAPAGTPIWAAAAGRVVFAGPHSGYGLYVAIRHPSLNVMTLYSGSRELCVRVNDRVRRGQVIGILGQRSGEKTGRLQWEVKHGDEAVPSGRQRSDWR